MLTAGSGRPHSRAADAAEVTQAGEPTLRAPDEPRVRVLVVDDEAVLAELLTIALTRQGWEVRKAADGLSAVAAADEFRPHLLLLDVNLPGIDGFEVLRRVRARVPQARAMFLTARDAPEDRAAGLAVGGDDYMTKPFGLVELVARLHALLHPPEDNPRRGAAPRHEARTDVVRISDVLLRDARRHGVNVPRL